MPEEKTEVTDSAPTVKTEGWITTKMPAGRHYYRWSLSLCRQWQRPTAPHDEDQTPKENDCPACAEQLKVK